LRLCRSNQIHNGTNAHAPSRFVRFGQAGDGREPGWSDVDAEDIESRVVELAEQGHDPSVIGLKLRDEGVKGVPVPDVKLATGKKLTDILEAHDADSEFPEDLRNLMAQAVRLREHMAENGQDHQNKRSLQNTESKIRRLANYYRGDEIDEEFTYTHELAAAELLEDE